MRWIWRLTNPLASPVAGVAPWWIILIACAILLGQVVAGGTVGAGRAAVDGIAAGVPRSALGVRGDVDAQIAAGGPLRGGVVRAVVGFLN